VIAILLVVIGILIMNQNKELSVDTTPTTVATLPAETTEATEETEATEVTEATEPEETEPEETEPEEVEETLEVIEETEPEEIEENPDVIAIVEETEEIPEAVEEPNLEDAEVEEILASIPCVDEETEEENTVEAIDIFWEERTHKTYRYDPDGNSVEEGDVVLVPTRDEASDKDIVREAEVARGNYKIDPATLDRPLKKIIGVVRRKAEQIFTAMITPTEEKED
jgi:hypothetical protein